MKRFIRISSLKPVANMPNTNKIKTVPVPPEAHSGANAVTPSHEPLVIDFGTWEVRADVVRQPDSALPCFLIKCVSQSGICQPLVRVSLPEDDDLFGVAVWEDPQTAFPILSEIPVASELADELKPTVISDFSGEFLFLRNSFPSLVEYDGLRFLNAEAAFQASKCEDPALRAFFCNLDARSAKLVGNQVALRSAWEYIKVALMEDIVMLKFVQNDALKDQLLATGDAEIVMGNDRHQNEWGACRCAACQDGAVGLNHMGEILMRVRDRLGALEE